MLSSLAFLVLVAVSSGEPRDVKVSGVKVQDVEFPDLHLTLTLPAFDGLASKPVQPGNLRGEWTGKRGASDVQVLFHAMSSEEYDFFEPEDVVRTWRSDLYDDEDQDKETDFAFGPMRRVAGAAGATPILVLTQAKMTRKAKPSETGDLFLLGALLMEKGWSLRVEVWPALAPEAANALALELEACATYSGPERDPKWSDAEATALWKKLAPESTFAKLEKPVRTAHYLVLTNSPSPGPFVKKLESWYSAIQKAIPCEELPGRRLMPILLFRTDDDFQAFYRQHEKMKADEEVSEMSTAEDFWMATSLDDDDEWEIPLDLAQQLMMGRLDLWGGCRWMRSGLRECVGSKAAERVETLRAVKKGRFTPLERLLDDSAWGEEDEKLERRGTSDQADYWEQSALWMEFLRDGPFPKGSFQHMVQSLGAVERDPAAVRAVLETFYGSDLAALQKQWVEYWSKKK